MPHHNPVIRIPVLRTIMDFLRGFLARDRYLTEALAAVTTFGIGVVASMTLGDIQTRVSLAGFRDMPAAEFTMALFTIPGIIDAVNLCREGNRFEGLRSIGVMCSFLVLCACSHFLGWDNWVFWTLFTLLLGLMKGYALIREWPSLRWSVTLLGAGFWIIFSASLATNLPAGLQILAVPPIGWAAANLLSVSRLSGRRGHA